ncbi:MAG: hypothetical protein ACLFUI_01425 [Halanaerobiales bacterium]
MKKKMILLLAIVALVLMTSSNSFAEENQINVRVNVEAMQELDVREPVGITFYYPWEGMESGQPLIIKNIGNLNIKSNVDWALNISSMERYRDLEVYISPTNAGQWQRVDGFNSIFTGEYGNQDISWDIKIVQSRSNYGLNSRSADHVDTNSRNDEFQETRTLNMMYTLTQI